MMQAYRFRCAMNGVWVYVRLEDEDGEEITIQDATAYIMDRLRTAGHRNVPWLVVQHVSLDEAKISGMIRWPRPDVFGLTATPLIEARDMLRGGNS